MERELKDLQWYEDVFVLYRRSFLFFAENLKMTVGNIVGENSEMCLRYK